MVPLLHLQGKVKSLVLASRTKSKPKQSLQEKWSPRGFPRSSVGKESACSAGDLGSIPGSGWSPGEGNSNPLQYSCLENRMDRRAGQATVHGVPRVRHGLATKPPPPAPAHHQSVLGEPPLMFLSFDSGLAYQLTLVLQYSGKWDKGNA